VRGHWRDENETRGAAFPDGGEPVPGPPAPSAPAPSPAAAAPAPRLLDQVRAVLRRGHYSLRTEEAYLDWIKRFIRFHGSKRHPAGMAEAEVAAFLTHLAVAARVAASTQNQALSALLFLYRDVLERPLERVEGVAAVTRPARLSRRCPAARLARAQPARGAAGQKPPGLDRARSVRGREQTERVFPAWVSETTRRSSCEASKAKYFPEN
jgi:hypothetical protein